MNGVFFLWNVRSSHFLPVGEFFELYLKVFPTLNLEEHEN